MATSGFWTGSPTVDPARQFRFRILIADQFVWWAKTCDKPKVNIPVLGKDEYYLGSNLPDVKPGEIVDFQPITMTFIDPAGENSFVDDLMARFSPASGECFPRINSKLWRGVWSTGVAIEAIDEKAVVRERWTLNGAFPTSIDFGSLDYGSDEFVEISITWEYTSFSYVSTKTKLTAQASNTELDINKLDGGFI